MCDRSEVTLCFHGSGAGVQVVRQQWRNVLLGVAMLTISGILQV